MKKIKKLWKKCKIAVLVEILVIVAICGCFGITYKLTYKLEKERAYRTIELMGELTEFKASEGVDNYLAKQWVQFLSSIGPYDCVRMCEDEYWGYAFVWSVHDNAGETIAESDGNDLIITWNNQEDVEAFQIEKYFSKEEMDEFWEFYLSRDSMATTDLHIDNVVGYYNEKNEYVPVEISFIDYSSQKNTTYTLRNEKNADKDGVKYITRRGDRIKSSDVSVDEEGTFEISFFQKSLPSVAEKARKIFDGADYNYDDCICWTNWGEWFDRSGIEDEEDIKIDELYISFCADIKYMTLINCDFREYVKYEIIFCQVIGFLIMYILYKNEKKRKYLESMKYTFINAMAHEMKTPSAVVVNSVECIKDGIKPEKQSKYLDKVKKEGLHMNRLLLDMLTYTKLTDEDRKLNKEEVNMRELFEEVIENYADAIEKKNIELQWNIQSEKVISADRKLMEMVVDNYLSNAVKYCKPSGIIKISMSGKNIVVYNDGENIRGKKLKEIWEPLYVIDESRKSREGSSGMGLAITAKILKLHNMSYGCRNTDNGVEFYICIRR